MASWGLLACVQQFVAIVVCYVFSFKLPARIRKLQFFKGGGLPRGASYKLLLCVHVIGRRHPKSIWRCCSIIILDAKETMKECSDIFDLVACVAFAFPSASSSRAKFNHNFFVSTCVVATQMSVTLKYPRHLFQST